MVFLHKFKHSLNFYFLLKIIMRWAWHLYMMVKMINWTFKFWNSCDLKWSCLGDIYVWSGNQISPIKLSWSKYNEIVLGLLFIQMNFNLDCNPAMNERINSKNSNSVNDPYSVALKAKKYSSQHNMLWSKFDHKWIVDLTFMYINGCITIMYKENW